MRTGYNRVQIALHWLIAVFLPVQYLTGGSIERTHHAVHLGLVPSSYDLFQHAVHNYTGIAVGGLMVLRLALRLAKPPSPAARNRNVYSFAASLMHFALYAAVIFQAALGFTASFITFSVAPIHVVGAYVIMILVAAHFAAAAWHGLVVRDNILDRMMLPRDDQPATWMVRKAKTR